MTTRDSCLSRPTRRHGAALLCAVCAAFLAFAVTAAAAPLDFTLPFFVAPPDEPQRIDAAAPAPVRRGDFSAAGDSTAHGFVEGSLLFLSESETIDRHVDFAAKNIAVGAVTLDVSLAAVSQSTADTLTIDRLIEPGAFDGSDIQTSYAGYKFSLGDRMTLASRLAVSNSAFTASSVFRDGLAPSAERHGEAMWHELSAKLLDTGTWRWTLAAQFGFVDADFRAPSVARPKASPVVAGTRTYVMNRIEYDGTSLSLAQQTIDGPQRTVETARATLGFASGQVTVYRRDNTTAPAQLSASNATHSLGLVAEVYGSALLASEDWARWLPELASVTVESVDQTSRTAGMPARARGTTLSAEFDWSSSWGQTALSYWRQDLAAVTPNAAGEHDELIDVSQQFAVGRWRASIGVSYDAFLDGESALRGLSGHAAIAYSAPEAVEIKLGIDHRKDDSLWDADLPREQSKGLDLSLSVDATPYLKSELGWQHGAAKLEYRRQLRSDETLGAVTDEASEALLVSFSAPL